MGKPRAVPAQSLSTLRYAVCPVLAVASTAGGAVMHAEDGLKTILGHEAVRFDEDSAERRATVATMLVAYALVLHGSRCVSLGVHYASETLWGCNFSMLLCALGMLWNRPVLVGAASCVVAVDQLCWYVDTLAFVGVRSFPVGVAKYLLRPETSRLHKLTSTHHLWFLPVCLGTLRSTGMPAGSYAMSVVLTSVLVVFARALTPYAVDEGSAIKVFNINLAFEFWDDVKLPFVHALDHHPNTALYLVFLIFVCNCVLNSIPVAILYYIADVLHGTV